MVPVGDVQALYLGVQQVLASAGSSQAAPGHHRLLWAQAVGEQTARFCLEETAMTEPGRFGPPDVLGPPFPSSFRPTITHPTWSELSRVLNQEWAWATPSATSTPG